jgi:acyl carrier protein
MRLQGPGRQEGSEDSPISPVGPERLRIGYVVRTGMMEIPVNNRFVVAEFQLVAYVDQRDSLVGGVVTMDRKKFLGKIEEVIEAESDSLREDTLLADVPEWNSLAIIGFISLMDEEFGKAPNPKDILACVSVADLLSLAEAELGA